MRITNFAVGKLCCGRIYVVTLLMCVVLSLSASLIAQVSVTISPSTVTLATLATIVHGNRQRLNQYGRYVAGERHQRRKFDERSRLDHCAGKHE